MGKGEGQGGKGRGKRVVSVLLAVARVGAHALVGTFPIS